MLTESHCQKIIEKIQPLINKEMAVFGPDHRIIVKTENLDTSFLDPKKIIPVNCSSNKIGYIYIEDEPAKVKEFKGILNSFIELFLEQQNLLEKIPAQDRFLDKFVNDLLSHKQSDKLLAEQAKVFGIALEKPRIAVAILINGKEKEILTGTNISGEEKENYIQRIRRNIGRALDSFYTNHTENIIAYYGENIFVVLKDIGETEDINKSIEHFNKTVENLHYVVKSETRNAITIGVGRFYNETSGLGQSFGEALLTARLGEDLWGVDGIYHFDSFGVLAPLLSGPDAISSTHPIDIFTKFSNKNEVLKTLNAFFNTNMSLTETAKKLKIHRNTLIYRLDKIAETIDLDPRIFDSAVQIKLAMLFNNFLAGEAYED